MWGGGGCGTTKGGVGEVVGPINCGVGKGWS